MNGRLNSKPHTSNCAQPTGVDEWSVSLDPSYGCDTEDLVIVHEGILSCYLYVLAGGKSYSDSVFSYPPHPVFSPCGQLSPRHEHSSLVLGELEMWLFVGFYREE